jgi:hypothetical protein
MGGRIDRKRRPAKKTSRDRVNRDRNGKIRARSEETGGSTGYGGSPPFGHLLHLGTVQIPRYRLQSLALVGQLGGSRLGFSLGTG